MLVGGLLFRVLEQVLLAKARVLSGTPEES